MGFNGEFSEGIETGFKIARAMLIGAMIGVFGYVVIPHAISHSERPAACADLTGGECAEAMRAARP